MDEKILKAIEDKYLGDIEITRENYKKLFDRGVELLRREQFQKHLLLETLEEYASRLDEIPGVDLSLEGISKQDKKTKEKIKSLILFGTQAVLINDNSKINAELKQANSSYEEVLGLITHEFKNLLTSIYGYNRILSKHIQKEKNEELPQILNSVERLTRKLYNMVDSLLKMSLGEKGILKTDLKLIDFIADVYNPVLEDLNMRLKKQGMKIQINADKKSIMLLADEELLQVAMRNLLENAIKYGKEKSTIIVLLKQSEEYLTVTVRNEGLGLSKANQKRVFEKFRRAAVGNVKGGTGLGLYNVKNIIAIHNGVVTCKSEFGKWAEFEFRLPLNIG